MSDKKVVPIRGDVSSYERLDGTAVLTSVLDPVLFKFYDFQVKAFDAQSLRVVELTTRINVLNAEKSVLEQDVKKWKIRAGFNQFFLFILAAMTSATLYLKHF